MGQVATPVSVSRFMNVAQPFVRQKSRALAARWCCWSRRIEADRWLMEVMVLVLREIIASSFLPTGASRDPLRSERGTVLCYVPLDGRMCPEWG